MSCSNPKFLNGAHHPCRNRDARVCKSCANKYWTDVITIALDGVERGSGDFDYVRVTATLKGTGLVHGQSGGVDGRCRCGAFHTAPQVRELQGVPIDFDAFDFDLLFKLNCSIPALLKATNARLRKVWPGLAYLAFHEFQRRMAVHVNLIYRLPHDDKLDATVLEEVIKAVTTRAYWAGSEPTDDVAWGSVEVQALETAEVIDGNWFEARRARLATETGKPDRTVKTVDDAIGYGAKDLTSGRPRALGKAQGAFLARLSEVAERTPCPNCFGQKRPEVCSSNYHREFGRSSNTFSYSAFRGRTSGWSPHHLTLGALREERRLLGRMAGAVRRGECEPDFNLIERIFHDIARSGVLGGVLSTLGTGPVRDHDRWLTSSRARLIEGVVTYDSETDERAATAETDERAATAETAEVATTAETAEVATTAETAEVATTAETATIDRRPKAIDKWPLRGPLDDAKEGCRALELRSTGEVIDRIAAVKASRAPPRAQGAGFELKPGRVMGPTATASTSALDGDWVRAVRHPSGPEE